MTLLDFLPALLKAGVPLFLLAFALVSWGLHRGWLSGDSFEELQGSMEALGKAQKNKKSRQQMDPALGKWYRFGGGFYGLVALYTWILIEWEDISNFLTGLAQVAFNMDPGALIALVIELLVESLVNFVLAIAWPAYWLAESSSSWITLLMAYGGYWLGVQAAQYAWRDGLMDRAVARISEFLRRGD